MIAVQLAQPSPAAAVDPVALDCCQLSSGCFAFDATQSTCPGETNTAASCVAGLCVRSTPGTCGDGVIDSTVGEECDPPGGSCAASGGGAPFLDCLDGCTCGLAVVVDIRPGSDGNPVNPGSNGVIAVALLGSDDLDVADVDVTTLAFGPAAAPVDPVGGHLADVNQDRILDLLSHYRTPRAGIQPGDAEACLVGTLLDGTPFEGCDAIETVSNDENGLDVLSGPRSYECGGHVIFENKNPVSTFSVTVSLEDNCSQSGEPSDSQIICRTDVSDPDSEYDAIRVPDGEERTFRCEDIPGPGLTPIPPPGEKPQRPSGGGVFIFCDGLDGDCIVRRSKPKLFIPDDT
jgi:hypothetical protein